MGSNSRPLDLQSDMYLQPDTLWTYGAQCVSVAEETGLSLALSEILKTGFVASRPIHEVPIITVADNTIMTYFWGIRLGISCESTVGT